MNRLIFLNSQMNWRFSSHRKSMSQHMPNFQCLLLNKSIIVQTEKPGQYKGFCSCWLKGYKETM